MGIAFPPQRMLLLIACQVTPELVFVFKSGRPVKSAKGGKLAKVTPSAPVSPTGGVSLTEPDSDRVHTVPVEVHTPGLLRLKSNRSEERRVGKECRSRW